LEGIERFPPCPWSLVRFFRGTAVLATFYKDDIVPFKILFTFLAFMAKREYSECNMKNVVILAKNDLYIFIEKTYFYARYNVKLICLRPGRNNLF
jgi:hypothetical protein